MQLPCSTGKTSIFAATGYLGSNLRNVTDLARSADPVNSRPACQITCQPSSGRTMRMGRVPIFAPVTSSTAIVLISVPFSASKKRTRLPPPRC